MTKKAPTGAISSKPLNKRKLSMTSENKFWPSKKKNGRSIEVNISTEELQAFVEQRLRSLSIIRPNEEINVKFPWTGESLPVTFTIQK